MKQFLEHHDLVRKNMLAIIGIGLCFYFSYHLLQGERSYFRYLSVQQQLTEINHKMAIVKSQRASLEGRVAMLRSSSIDKDLLEERARIVLGFRRPGEKDILVEKEPK